MLLFLEIALLPVLFFIGLITSYEDIKLGKIRNKWISWGLGWGLAVFLLLIAWFFIAAPITHFYYFQVLGLPADSAAPVYTFNLDFLLRSLVNFVCASLAAFFLWRFNSWAAGDAKLFLTYALLIPIFFYERSYLPVFPSFALLVNIFFVFLVYLSASIIIYFSRSFYAWLLPFLSEKFGFLPESQMKKIIWSINWPEARKKIWGSALGLILPLFIVLAMGFFQSAAKKYFQFDLLVWQPFVFATLIIFNKIMSAVARRRWLLIILASGSVFVCAYGLAIDYSGALATIGNALISMAVFTILFALFQGLMDLYFKKNYSSQIEISALAPGMLVDPALWRELDLAEGESAKFQGLNEQQVKKIQDIFSGKKITTIEIFKSSPFALWVFGGAILTLILKGSILNFLLKLTS